MFQKIQKTAYYAFIAFLGVLALAIVSTLFPIPGNFQILVVQSGSMEPAIRTGAVVVLKPVSEYNVGDVITFGPVTAQKPPTTHRVVDMEVQSGNVLYVTKGDANEDPDPRAVAAKDILGKVFFSVPFLGYVLDFAKQPLGFALIIGLPAAIIIGDEIRKIVVETKRLVKEKHAKN